MTTGQAAPLTADEIAEMRELNTNNTAGVLANPYRSGLDRADVSFLLDELERTREALRDAADLLDRLDWKVSAIYLRSVLPPEPPEVKP